MQSGCYTSQRTADTEAVGRALAAHLSDAGVTQAFIALWGDLGAGKTAFVRGFVSALSDARVKSPTYTIVNEYSGRVPVYHFDMYRIDGEDDLYSTGFYDYLDAGFLLCEWSENIPFALPEKRIDVRIEKAGETGRRITIEDRL